MSAAKFPKDEFPDEPAGDRVVLVLLLLAAGSFAIMLIWLVGR